MEGVPDRRRAGIVFAHAGVRSLADMVVADLTGASMIDFIAHILGHATTKLLSSRRRLMLFI